MKILNLDQNEITIQSDKSIYSLQLPHCCDSVHRKNNVEITNDDISEIKSLISDVYNSYKSDTHAALSFASGETIDEYTEEYDKEEKAYVFKTAAGDFVLSNYSEYYNIEMYVKLEH